MSKNKTKKEASLSDSCVKVQVTIKTYSGIKTDKKTRKEVADNKNANEDLVDVHKWLFGKGKDSHLSEPIRLGNQFRNQVMYKWTLPWIDADDQVLGGGKSYLTGTSREIKKGEWRLLPSNRLEDFEKAVKEYKKKFFDAVDEIIEGYDDAVIDAKQHNTGLGDLFDERDYPTPDELRNRYVFVEEVGIVNEFSVDDIRVNLSDDLRERIVKDTIAKEQSVKTNADRYTAQRLIDLTSKLADSLDNFEPDSPSKHPLRTSYDNLKNLLDIASDQLLTEDTDLKKVVSDLRKTVAKAQSRENLSKDDKVRKTTTKKLRDAEQKIKISDTAKGLF